MPSQAVDAIVLSHMRYGETSKIVRLGTRDLGVQSAIAKGAYRPNSRFGAALQLWSEGVATLFPARTGDLHTLAAFDVTCVREGLALRLDRYAVAGALTEVMLRFAPAAPVPAAYDLLRDALAVLEVTPEAAVETIGLRMLWRLMAALGFEPMLDTCARDGTPLPRDQRVAWSAREGGALCPSCAGGGEAATTLDPAHRRDLAALIGADAPLPVLDPLHEAAHRRLLVRWIECHQGDDRPLPAVAFFLSRPRAPAA